LAHSKTAPTGPGPIRRICPYLGILGDPASHYLEPDAAHFCYSPKEPGQVEVEHQQTYCFSADHAMCPHFTAFPEGTHPIVPTPPAAVSHRKRLLLLLGLLIVLPLVVVLVSFLALVPRGNPGTLTQVAIATRTRTARLSETPLPHETPTPTVRSLPALEPLIIPTPPANGVLLTLSADPARTGWIASTERLPHWDERSLLVGSQRGQNYMATFQFEVSALPPGSTILFAVVELVGKDGTRLATMGEWTLELLDAAMSEQGDLLSFDQLANVPALASMASPFTAAQLGAGVLNRWELNAVERELLARQLEYGRLVFRLRGPMAADNLFVWSAGSGTPTLYLIATLPPLAVVTVTPTPGNVLTAAAISARATEFATRFGTPTRAFLIATATPAAGMVIVTPIPTPANSATAQFQSAYATAVAMTTGTFTPTPANFITTTPLPLLIPAEQLTPIPSPTPTISPLNRVELARKPIPSNLYNKILFLEGARTNPRIWAMDPDGKNVALLTNPEIYEIAQAREVISPDGRFFVVQDRQLWLLDLNYPNLPLRQITYHARARLVYGPAWSPDGKKIAYVSDELGTQDIWVYTLTPQSWDRITVANEKDNFWNQFPSWSPDGRQIVFSSDRGHSGTFSEIWVMNADGSGARKLGNGVWDTYAPVWIKWTR
jgi:hypothetical protein